jgi:hypothetical protein
LATQTIDMVRSADAFVTVTYSDINGAIQSLGWNVTAGRLTVIVHQSGKQDISMTKTAPDAGSQNVPNGYNLTKPPKGDWCWMSTTSSFDAYWAAV